MGNPRKIKRPVDVGRIADAGPRAQDECEFNAPQVDSLDVVVEGNCRVACLRLIARQMVKPRGGAGRGRAAAGGRAPRPEPGA